MRKHIIVINLINVIFFRKEVFVKIYQPSNINVIKNHFVALVAYGVMLEL